ncbi:MAG: TrmB family transcriptional regulator [Thermoprotei archaeon ex4572_64]|nr:MAG: TrmB family transcriptional regulator [Thermoprotei archaeon ex4572_64]
MVEGVKKKILDFLTSRRGQEFSVDEIAKAVGEERLNVVKAQLTRLVKEGKIVRTDGKYKAP